MTAEAALLGDHRAALIHGFGWVLPNSQSVRHEDEIRVELYSTHAGRSRLAVCRCTARTITLEYFYREKFVCLIGAVHLGPEVHPCMIHRYARAVFQVAERSAYHRFKFAADYACRAARRHIKILNEQPHERTN